MRAYIVRHVLVPSRIDWKSLLEEYFPDQLTTQKQLKKTANCRLFCHLQTRIGTVNILDRVRYEGNTLNAGLTQKNAAETPEMHQVFVEGALIRKLDHLLCSTLKAVAIVSVAGSQTKQSGAMPPRRGSDVISTASSWTACCVARLIYAS